MALNLSFMLPPNGQATPATIAQRRRLAAALLQQAGDASPVASPWQAVARLAQGLVGGIDEGRANSQEQQGISGANKALAAALQGNDPNALATAFNDPFVSPQAAIMAREQYQIAHPPPPDPFTLGPGDVRYGSNGQVIASGPAPQPKPPDPFTLGEGQVRYGPNGEVIASGPSKTSQPSAGFVQGPNDANGRPTWIPITGGPQDPNRPVPVRNLRPTTDQSNAAGFYDRMTEADKILSDPAIATEGMSLIEKNAARLPFGAGNYVVSENYQKFDQATRNFVNAVLRKESGAAISEGEFENARRQYFPQPGDSKEVLQQKAQNRATAIAAMHRSAGPALQVTSETAQPVPSPDADATISAARDAISQGADPEAVKQRLIENGIDPSGL
jgi:hypothetical protein